MKTIKIVTVLTVLICSMLAVKAQTPQEKRLAELQARQQLDKGAYETQCTIYDDDQWYTAFNQKLGEEGDPQLANSLLRTCQEQLRNKLAGKVQQITTAYFDQMDINGKSSAAEHIEGASQIAVEQFINETREYCRKQTISYDHEGKIVLYMAIRVKKSDILQVMDEAIKNDSEAKVRYNEKKFRESAFKVFNEDKPQND
ncbi:MAG: hypothetical protein IJT12_00080 [Paludibacteraceae bacterium]|nr:hypothetical protein [Paludibacteraceae bacterium]